MLVSEFDYDLPRELIAQAPPAERGASRLLVLDRASDAIIHTQIAKLPDHLRASDLLVVNNTKVFPARLLGVRRPSGGAVECLLLRRLDAERWEALMHPGQKLRPGGLVEFGGGGSAILGEILEQKFYGRRIIRLRTADGADIESAIDALGHVPLPPYIKRPDQSDDRERYQTVFARHRGSIAAPTAGLHFTSSSLDALGAAGVELTEITLHVGYGTFEPVRVEQVEDHQIQTETYEIGPDAAKSLNRALRGRRRVVAVGTTTTRALEAAWQEGRAQIEAGRAATGLFIYPGFDFRIVGALLTNFHLPRSSLLMLACAFAGRERVLGVYREAIERGYRFYSYGDAMLIT